MNTNMSAETGGARKSRTTGILPRQMILPLLQVGIVAADVGVEDNQIQPASMDLRLGANAYRVRTSFLPGPDATVAEIHRLRTSGARIITIGVGDQVQQNFLASLASGPNDYHFCNEAIDLEGTFINLATELSNENRG